MKQAIMTENSEAQKDVAHKMIQIIKTAMIRKGWELILTNGKLRIKIPTRNAHPDDLKWTENQQAKLKTFGERKSSQGASEASRVQDW